MGNSCMGNLSVNPLMLMGTFAIESILRVGIIGILIAKIALVGALIGGAIVLVTNLISGISDFFTGKDSKGATCRRDQAAV